MERRTGFDSESFPAGHIMSGAVLYGFLLGLAALGAFPRPASIAIGAVSATILLLNAPANVYMGVHWPSDVTGGFLWALVLLVPAFAALVWLRTPRRGSEQRL